MCDVIVVKKTLHKLSYILIQKFNFNFKFKGEAAIQSKPNVAIFSIIFSKFTSNILIKAN